MLKEDVKWLAATTDCESGIFIVKHKRHYKNEIGYTYEGCWAVSMVTPAYLETIKKMLNLQKKIQVHKKDDEEYRGQYISFKTQYRLAINEQNFLKTFLEELEPHLIIKKNQARLMIEFINFKKRLTKGHKPSEEERAKEEDFYQKMKSLNA